MPDIFSSYPAELPATDREKWASMTAGQRITANQRLIAFNAWHRGEIEVDAAVEASGLTSRSRFYHLAAEWRRNPSLEALGALAGSGAAKSRQDKDVVNALQAVVPKIVRDDPNAKVSELVRRMLAAAGDKLTGKKLPGPVRLRQFVETELRRYRATGQAGTDIRFDCSAIDIPREGGRPFIMFASIDAGTRLILGSAVTDEPATFPGYRLAAEDALPRISSEFAKLDWSERLERVEIVAGADIATSEQLAQTLREVADQGQRQKISMSVAKVEKRFGRYIRDSVGDSLGRVLFTPRRTLEGDALPNNKDMRPWSLADATAAVRVAVAAYNQMIMTELAQPGKSSPPSPALALIKALAGQQEA